MNSISPIHLTFPFFDSKFDEPIKLPDQLFESLKNRDIHKLEKQLKDRGIDLCQPIFLSKELFSLLFYREASPTKDEKRLAQEALNHLSYFMEECDFDSCSNFDDVMEQYRAFFNLTQKPVFPLFVLLMEIDLKAFLPLLLYKRVSFDLMVESIGKNEFMQKVYIFENNAKYASSHEIAKESLRNLVQSNFDVTDDLQGV